MRRTLFAAVLSVMMVSVRLGAQGGTTPPPMQHMPGMQHTPGMEHGDAAGQPTQGGQAAFAAVTEIVKILEADPMTDWSKVNLEALRQHLIDMDAVTLRSRVQQMPTTGGLMMNVTGDPATAASIRRMVTAHAPMLEDLGGWRATAVQIPGGMRLTVVASNPADAATIAKIRGLGFIGLMTEGAHHTEHHLLIAKGAGAHAHASP